MRKILIIGIGAGNPEHLTIQAVNALRQVSVVFITDKGPHKEELARLRREICERYIPNTRYRTVEIADPERDRNPPDYRAAVETWHGKRSRLYETVITTNLGDDECGAFLVWGDPSLYDSTIRIVGGIAAHGSVAFEYEVIPGISSIQALTARHRIPLNQIGEPVQITTGRRLAEDSMGSASDVIVMLDGDCAFTTVADDELEIYWGAYLGTPDEILLSGKLRDTAASIGQVRAEARQRKGWIMDTYLLRKPARARDQPGNERVASNNTPPGVAASPTE
jgi:precorrin-6A synthase